MTYHFLNELGFITIPQKIISLLVIGVHLGSSILLYVESFGDRLLLMRTHEDLSSDMELLVSLCILWFCCDILSCGMSWNI